MINKEDSIGREKRFPANCKPYYVYIFRCLNCSCNIYLQQGAFKRHTGKCSRCCQKGKPYAHILAELKHTNFKRGLEVTLTYDEFINLISNNKCHYCDSIVTYNEHTRDNEGNHVSRAYQLDRKDNNIGYTKDNCVVCCWECNRLKSNRFTYEEFMLLSDNLKLIIKNRNGEI